MTTNAVSSCFDQDFKNMVATVLNFGENRPDRTGVGTRGIFGGFLTHNLRAGFPALTLKRLPFKVMAGELACFLKGHTDIREFHKRGCHIWDANLAAYNAKEKITPEELGEEAFQLGPVYGAQWRAFGKWGFGGSGIDQFRQAIDTAKTSPGSRRLFVSAWNPQEEEMMVLPPCHTHWQISVRNLDQQCGDQYILDLAFYMRSVDVMLGFPFDIASYSLLAHLIARECGFKVGNIAAFLGDVHIYANHIDGALELLERPSSGQVPQLKWNEDVIAEAVTKNPLGFRVEDFEPSWVDLENYDPAPAIKLPMAV